MIKIPNNNQWKQTNKSDIFGSLYISKNLDLTSNYGKLRVAPRMLLNTSTDDVAEINGVPAGFRYFGTTFYTIAGNGTAGYVFSAGGLHNNFSKIANGGAISGAPTKIDSDTDDIEVFNDKLWVSSAIDGKVYYTADALTWSNVSAGSAGSAVMMTSYGDRLYVTKLRRQVQSIDASQSVASPSGFGNTTSYTLYLTNSNESITFMRTVSDGIWIGTVNNKGGKGNVYKWNGQQTSINSAYRLESAGALAGTIKDDVLYIIDAQGRLMAFNGATFVELASVNRTKNKFLFNPFSPSNQRFIHPNGLALINGKLSCLIDGVNYDATGHAGTQEETIPSGIWEYDENIGLYHKYSFGLSKGSGTILDYGQFRIAKAGAINEIQTASSPITTDGSFLAGVSYRADSTKTTTTGVTSGIFYNNSDDDEQKSGYFVTTKMTSSQIKDSWQKLAVFFKKFLATTDKIVVKYTTDEIVRTEIAITWTSATTFTTTNNVLDYHPNTLGYNPEIEILQGQGSGLCAHVTGIDFDGTNYTLTINETSPVTSGTALAVLSNWKKIDDYTGDDDLFILPIGVQTNWIKFKVYMLFTGQNEINGLTLINSVNQEAK